MSNPFDKSDSLNLATRYNEELKKYPQTINKICGKLPCKFNVLTTESNPNVKPTDVVNQMIYIKPNTNIDNLNKLCIYKDRNDNYINNPKILVSGVKCPNDPNNIQINRIATIVGKEGRENVAKSSLGKLCIFDRRTLNKKQIDELMGNCNTRQTYWRQEYDNELLTKYRNSEKYKDITQYLDKLNKIEMGVKKGDRVVEATFVDSGNATLNNIKLEDGFINKYHWDSDKCLGKGIKGNVYFAMRGKDCQNKNSYLGMVPTRIVSSDAKGTPRTYVDNNTGSIKECVLYDNTNGDQSDMVIKNWAGTCDNPPNAWKKIADKRIINSDPDIPKSNSECNVSGYKYVHNIPFVNRFTHPYGQGGTSDPVKDMRDNPSLIRRLPPSNIIQKNLSNEEEPEDGYLDNYFHEKPLLNNFPLLSTNYLPKD